MARETDPAATQGRHGAPDLNEPEGDDWRIEGGRITTVGSHEQFNDLGVEPLTFNNPFSQKLERVWFDGKLVFALDAGELEIEEAGDVAVAKEYQPVFEVTLNKKGKPEGEPEEVPGQYNIYDSVPGMPEYSPIWQFYYVVVPRDYKANTLRSAADCEKSGFAIHKSNVFEN